MRRAGISEKTIPDSLAMFGFDHAQIGQTTLPRAVASELGLRARLGSRVNLGAVAWWMTSSASSCTWATREPPSSPDGRHAGLDLEGRVRLLDWLFGDADVTLAHGEAPDEPDGADMIPLAPSITDTGGLTVRQLRSAEGSPPRPLHRRPLRQ